MQVRLSDASGSAQPIPAAAQNNTASYVFTTNYEPLPAGLLKKRYIRQLNESQSSAKESRTVTIEESDSKPSFPLEKKADHTEIYRLHTAPATPLKHYHQLLSETVELMGMLESAKPAAADIALPKLNLDFTELFVNYTSSISLEKKYLAETINPEEIKIFTESNYKIYDQGGNLLAVFVKKAFNLLEHDPLLEKIYAFSADSSYFHSVSRGAAAGKFDPSYFPFKDPIKWKINKNGFKANYEGQSFNKGNPHKSGTIGFLGHNNNGKIKCRTAAMGNDLLPEVEVLLNIISNIYQSCIPVKYNAQIKALEEHRVYAQHNNVFHGQIGKTPFTTLTVNVSAQGKPTTHVHRDKGNLADSFVALFVDGGHYTGGETAFPELRELGTNKIIAFSVNPGDILFFDGVKLLHGNTPVNKLHELADRTSFVAYAQKTLVSCKSCNIEAGFKNSKKVAKKSVEIAKTKRSIQKASVETLDQDHSIK